MDLSASSSGLDTRTVGGCSFRLMTEDGWLISWRSCCLSSTDTEIPTVKVELLYLGPHLCLDVEVDAGSPLICYAVVTEVKRLDLVETLQVACVSQFGDASVSEFVVAEVECFEIGEMFLRQHSPNNDDSIPLHRIIGQIDGAQMRSVPVLDCVT